MSNNNLFGYHDDTDSSLQTSVGKFGLNQNARLVKLELNETAGQNNSQANAIDIEFDVNGKAYYLRFYEEKNFYKNNEKLTPGDEGYDELYRKYAVEINSVVTHILKAVGVQENALKQLKGLTFTEFAEVANGLLPENFESIPLDLFLEYQFYIPATADRTYPTVPKNMKGGYFVCPHIPGNFREVIDTNGLHYVDENGNKHKFTKSADFMKSNKGKMQTLNSALDDTQSESGFSEPKKSAWDE